MAVRFGDCELSVERRELRREGTLVPVEPQVFDVLAHLIRHRHRVVPKTELLDEVWGDRFVSESALTSRIKSARRAIGDTGRDQRAIKTIHGRGYRLVADVDEEAADDPRADAPADRAVPAGVVSTARPEPGPDRALGALDELAAGRGIALRLEGGTRSARTEVLRRLSDAARARGLAVGLSAPSITGVDPFATVAEALDEMTQRRPDLLDGLPKRCRVELEQVFSGEPPTTRQRWLVSMRELLVTAAEASGAVLLIDHVDHATPESLALVDDLARLCRTHRVAVVVAGRPHARPGASSGTAPDWFEVVTLPAPDGADRPGPAALDLPDEVADALRKVALAGDAFDDVDLRAVTGHDEAAAHRLAEVAVAGGAIVADTGGYRFVDGVRGPLVGSETLSHQRSRTLEDTAVALARMGAPPARVADRFLAAGRPGAAAPYALDAARAAAAIQFHRDVLRWTEAARHHLTGDDAAQLLALRADALSGVGDPGAVAAYRAALAAGRPEEVRGLRARMARAALVLGDLGSAQESLAGLEPDGGPDDVAVLGAVGMFAYYTGDVDAAERAADAARVLAVTQGTPAQLLQAINLQGMVAHHRGEWFDRLRRELRATSENPALASTVFDSHLCVAEYLLYGPTPYDEVIELTGRLRQQADDIGARPAAAFAAVVAGEAALLGGDLDAARERLSEAVDLHTAIDAETGTAHALQRLAEVELADGDRAAAERLLRRALPLARWSPLASHLLQRIYGTLVAAAPDNEAALALVDEAVEASDIRNLCLVCHVMIAAPAAIACAEAGRVDDAHEWLGQAANSAALWQGTAWQAAVHEAEAHVRRAEGDPAAAARLLAEAADLFDTAGQPLDAQRCRESADTLA